MLTFRQTAPNICLPLTHSAVGLGNPFSQGAGDCTIKGESLFLCLKYFMVGILGSLRACWLLDPVYQPGMSAARSLVTSVGGLITTVKELAMSQHSHEPTKRNTLTNKVSLKSIFSLLDSNKNLITSSLTMEQVKPLSKHIRGSIIKFQAMVRVEVLL